MKKICSFLLIALILLSTICSAEDDWVCPKCGNAATGNFCNSCGEKRPVTSWVCPNCNISMDGNFCSQCGLMRPVTGTTGLKLGDIITFGMFEQDNNFANGPEPIEWIVILDNGNTVELMSKKLLDARDYNDVEIDITWATCSLRTWLNTSFYENSFSADEKAAIKATYITDWLDSTVPGTDETDTVDNVFILGVKEAEIYLNGNYKAEATAYAKAKNVMESELNPNDYIWWLRTTGYIYIRSDGAFYHQDNAPYCGSNSVDLLGVDVGHGFTFGIRPCITVSKDYLIGN